jgi:hypothetical protein
MERGRSASTALHSGQIPPFSTGLPYLVLRSLAPWKRRLSNWRTEIAPRSLTDSDRTNSMILIFRARRLLYVGGALSHVELVLSCAFEG